MKNKSAFLDILGISSATLCLIHCIVFPMLTIIPLGLSHNHWIDLVFALIGLYAVIRIGKKQANRYIMLLFWVSIVLIFGCVVFEIASHHHSNLIYFGAFGLITGHFLNYKNTEKMNANLNKETFENNTFFDVIIIGGSYSGLSSAMALGRSLRKVLIIGNCKPCNIQTPHSHNFLTQDGKSPKEISEIAKSQVSKYETVKFQNGIAVNAEKTTFGFAVETDSGSIFTANKLIFATGLKDIFPKMEGFAECWGISILHCPYCHGYEVRNLETGIMVNGEISFELSKMISNWTNKLTLFTNGKATFTEEQFEKLCEKNIKVNEKEISMVLHVHGKISAIEFKDGSQAKVEAVYAKIDFEQHCKIPEKLGCEINEQGLLQVDQFQKTTVPGIYACGDNSAMRSVAFAVSTGSMSGVMANKDLIFESF